MSKKRGLNKGRVDLLLSEVQEWSVAAKEPQKAKDHNAAPAISASTGTILQQVAITSLTPGKFQPRKVMAEPELAELAESIKQQGVLQPIVVRNHNGQLEIVAGERRWRAATLAGLTQVPIIEHTMSDEEAMVIALIENIQRQDLNPMEEAYALERLAQEFNFTHEETAKAVGKSRATISNLLRLLQLQPAVKGLVEQGKLDLGHAKVLLALTGEQQSKIAKIVVERQLSVRETEHVVQQELAEKEPRATRPLDPDIARLQRSLSEKLGAVTKIQHHHKGRGKIVIKYTSIDELDGILEHIV